MEFKQLEAYVKVYEMQSFSKAAEELFLSQPSVSAYINALEQGLKTQLIYRSTKEFLPTKAGEAFYEHAKGLLALRGKALAAMKNLNDCKTGSIDILASSVPSQYILPEILGKFHKKHPGIVTSITQMGTEGAINGILTHMGEVAFVGSMIENPKCTYEHFLTEKLILIAPNEPRFQNIDKKDIVALLRKEHFVARSAGSGTRLEYEGFLRSLDISPAELKVSAYMNNTLGVIQGVANGLGLSFVSELTARSYVRKGLIISIDIENLPERKFYIVHKKDWPPTPATSALIAMCRIIA